MLRKTLINAALVSALLASTPAFAENYVPWHDREIDIDSIRTADGITLFESRKREYYEDGEDGPEWSVSTEAVDCARRQVFSAYSIKYESNWRSKGESYAPGTMGDDQVAFVCARRR